ncbi:MAG: SDR family oxidoreductase, partial [Caulobacterales bacterium]
IFGGIDILWSNAGTNGPAELEDMDLDHYNKTISLNLTAGILAAQACVPHLREKGGGAILFTSSTSGLVGSPRYAIYTATKFALVGYTKTLAQRLAPENIRVNAICPGQTDTPMVRNLVKGAAKEHLAGMMAAIPMGRAAEALEIAKTAYWLASEESSFVTGIALPVDGGFTSR